MTFRTDAMVIASSPIGRAVALLSLLRERAVALGYTVFAGDVHLDAECEEPESVRLHYRRHPGGVMRHSTFDAEMGGLLEAEYARLVELVDHELRAGA